MVLRKLAMKLGLTPVAQAPDTLSAIERRKTDHISINLEEDTQSASVTTGFERYRFVPAALPEIDLDSVDTGVTFLGKHLKVPILVSSMTGGVDRGGEINRRLARAAQDHGCAMGVGSQRAAIENPDLARSYRVRDVAPDILLLANLGAVQLNYGFGIDECRRAIEMIGADALILHLNPMQEALQSDGNRNFSNLLHKIGLVCSTLEVPVVVKEIGFGISGPDVRRLADVGVSAIDIAGSGGTSWSAVEHFRATTDHYRRLGETFTEWGMPTAWALQTARKHAPWTSLIASGGLKSGLDAAKAIALGAQMAGFAGPLLRAADTDEDAATYLLATIVEEFRLSMFGCGAASCADLHRADLMFGVARGQFGYESVRDSQECSPPTLFDSQSAAGSKDLFANSIERYERHAL